MLAEAVLPNPLPFARYQDMQNCIRCGGPQIFVPVFEVEAGRVGICFGCGEEKLVPFTRQNSET